MRAGVNVDRGLNYGLGAAGLSLAAALTSPAHAGEAPADRTPTGDSVVVTGQRTQLVTLSSQILNTPQDIQVIPASILHDQAVSSLQEALKNVPGITLNAGEGGSHGDDVSLRGFSASDDFFLDGLRDSGFYTRDVFNLEALEVYKGPASTLFGRGSSGGVLNQVSKTPKLTNFVDGTLGIGTANYYRGTVDVNQKLSDTSALRVNAYGFDSDIEGRDFVHNSRWGIAPTVEFGIGQPTDLILSYLHQSQDDIPDYGIPYFNGRPISAPRNTYYGLPSDDSNKADDDIFTARLAHKISDSLTFNDSFRFGDYFFDTRETAPHYATGQEFGDPVPPGVLPAQVLTFRDRPSVRGTVQTFENESALTWKTETGPFKHAIVGALELDRESADLERFANPLTTIPGTPILNPDPNEPFPGRQTQVTSRPDTTTTTIGVLLTDTISYGPHWDLTLGGRFDDFTAKSDTAATNVHLKHTDDVFSPRVALVYKPDDKSSVYFSYSTSFDPSAENLTTLSAKNANLDPEKDRTFEIGAKTMALDRRLTLTASLFDTELTDARVGDPTNPTAQVLAGNEKVLGFELGAVGHLSRNIEVLAGYTYLDARTTASSDPKAVGTLLPNTAHNQGNVFVTYESDARRWKAGAGMNWLGKRQADVDGLGETPGYVTFDALASYKVTDHIELRLNANNLFDKYYFTNAYFSSPEENHVLIGPGRTVILTAALKY